MKLFIVIIVSQLQWAAVMHPGSNLESSALLMGTLTCNQWGERGSNPRHWGCKKTPSPH